MPIARPSAMTSRWPAHRLLTACATALVLTGAATACSGGDTEPTDGGQQPQAAASAVPSSSGGGATLRAEKASRPQESIPGVRADELTTGLTDQYRLRFAEARDGASHVSRARGSDGVGTYGARVDADGHGRLHSATCTYAASPFGTDALLAASGFLGTCAALPREGRKRDQTKAWVIDNLERVRPGHPLSTTFGSTEVVLSAKKTSRSVTVHG